MELLLLNLMMQGLQLDFHTLNVLNKLKTEGRHLLLTLIKVCIGSTDINSGSLLPRQWNIFIDSFYLLVNYI